MILGNGFKWDINVAQHYYTLREEENPDIAFNHLLDIIKNGKDKRIEYNPFEISVKEFSRNGSICGMLGTGKSTLMRKTILESVKDDPNLSFVVIDPKPDVKIGECCKNIADETGKPYFVFDPWNWKEGDDTLNPIFPFDKTIEISQRISETFPDEAAARGGEAYRQFAKDYILCMSEALAFLGRRVSIDNLAQYCHPSELKKLLGENESQPKPPAEPYFPERIISRIKAYTEMSEGQFYKMLSDISINLHFLQTFPLCCNGEQGTISFERCLRNGSIVYIKLNGLRMGEWSNWIGKLVLANILAVVGKALSENNSLNAMLLIDETASMAISRFSELLRMGRQSGLRGFYSLLSYYDIKDITLQETLIQGTPLKFFFQSDHPKVIQLLSDITGNVPINKTTTSRSAGGAHGEGYSQESLPLIDPDIFRQLKLGECFVVLGGSNIYYVKIDNTGL